MSNSADTPDSKAAEARDQQLSEIHELTRELLIAARDMRGQATRDAALHEALDDVRAAARAVFTVAPQPIVRESRTESPVAGKRDCSCDCTDASCCSFEIVLSKVRAAKPQIEPPDMGDVPLLINALEVQIYVTVNSIGFLWPGLATTMDLRADGAPGGPGPWVIIERVVNVVQVKKGATATIELVAEVREHDEGVERPIAFKDEMGEGSGLITVDCCMAKVYPPMPIDVSLVHGGEGRGMIQLAFYARRVCC